MEDKKVVLYDSERIDDLLTHEIKIIQSHEVFCFSMDAVLLGRFATVPKRGKILDFCTGNGVIPLLLSTRTPFAKIEGIEIQERLYHMAERNVQINNLEERITMHHGDVKEAIEKLGASEYDLITCNPPYMPPITGKVSENDHRAIARHEIHLNLEDVIRVSSKMLKVGGKLTLVHRATRLIDITAYMRQYGIEPKRMRLVYPRVDAEPNMVLIEGVRGGKPELRISPPLIVYKQGEEYCEELYEVYYGNQNSLS
ncbi:tRNA1(Val) (adenine(37)-N6)-methyltransferase [Brevibacillus daliensis]|uniref:tRNA1(Val) (adenine(37)-N6)-methyltransferase n=1 Tax=Brevibacillus daliensis TaxID=2892995 RepID=UPI001E5DE04E|nr:tRNA1(Val) (adenine(37)-N6)-methyltransferase [Brevibacillus daliensis]